MRAWVGDVRACLDARVRACVGASARVYAGSMSTCLLVRYYIHRHTHLILVLGVQVPEANAVLRRGDEVRAVLSPRDSVDLRREAMHALHRARTPVP